MNVLGLDIGGANIKAASTERLAYSHPFPLWQKPNQLADFLKSVVIPPFPRPDHVALTMTGELCDCFRNKAEGVRHIIEAVEQSLDGISFSVYSVDGDFYEPIHAKENPVAFAASNWHAVANYSRRWLTDSTPQGVLVDIGSTSCDLIPISRDGVLAMGNTDLTRMANHELVYTGSTRTPVCAVTNQIRYRGTSVPIAQEIFATMQDVYVYLGEIEEQPNCSDTADGRPLTRPNSLHRLSRMLCADPEELVESDVHSMALEIRKAQLSLIEQALNEVVERTNCSELQFIYSGSGSFLIKDLLKSTNKHSVVNLEEKLGSDLSSAAPAFAVAILLNEKSAENRNRGVE